MENLELSDELIANIVEFMYSRNLSYRTIKEYYRILKLLKLKYKIINHSRIRKFLKDNKASTDIAVLKLINDFCYYEKIDFIIRIPRQKKKPRKLPPTLHKNEIDIIIKSAPKPYDLMIRCILNIGSGLRISEAIKMSWSNFNWGKWIGDKESKGKMTIRDAKGSKDRVVDVPITVMKDLYELAKDRNLLNEYNIPIGNIVFKCGMDGYKESLFTTNLEQWKNEYLRHAYDWFKYNVLKKHCEKALGKSIRIHSLRHSRATYLVEVEKVPIEIVRELLGHSALETTMIYTKISQDSVLDKVKKVGEM